MKKSQSIIIEKYHLQLLNYIKCRVNNIDDADDLLANVYVKFIAQPEMPANPIAWLYLVIKNAIVDYYRVHRSYELLPDDLSEDEMDDDHFKQFSACILPILNDMDEKDRLVIQLADIDCNKQQYVATRLNLSLSAFKSRLLRARTKLYTLMVTCCPPERNSKGTLVAFGSPSILCKNC